LRGVTYALISIVAVMIVGIVGFHEIEGMNLVNAIYFESMIATGQGPPFPLNTDTGKIFASVMAFVSVGSVITALFFTLAPVIAQIWREILEKGEEEVRRVEKDLTPKRDENSKADGS
jgi:uncharacterized oligopeptide transporter (OPT) family protein